MTLALPASYNVFPTGWEECALADKLIWMIRVERRDPTEDTWRVTDGFNNVLSSSGNWIYDDARHRRFTRFPLEEALAIAQRHVDDYRVNGHTLPEAIARVARLQAERDAQAAQDSQDETPAQACAGTSA